MAADRGAWIDQSQSFNHFVSDPNDDLLTTILLYGWDKGLKTGMYYLRRRTLVDPQKFSVDLAVYQNQLKKNVQNSEKDKQEKSVSPPISPQINGDPVCSSGSCGT